MKRALPAAIAALCVCASSSAFAQIVDEAGTALAPQFAGLSEGNVVLFDQVNNASGNGAPAQNFEASFDQYDNRGADDFEVNVAAGWTINQLNFVITQSAGGSPTSVDVAIHANSAGGGDPDLPGAPICSYTGLPPGQTGAPPSALNVVLSAPCILPQGRYWVSMTANQDFGGGNGQIFWSNRTVQDFSEGVWENPGDGFASGCTTFTPMTVCGVGGGVNPDFQFQVVGVVGGLDADISVTKTATAPAAPAINDPVTFTLTASNAGSGDAENTVVTDTLPANLTYVSNTCGAAVAGQVVTWTIGTLANGATQNCDIATTINNFGDIVNTATIASTTNDPNPGNNSSTVNVTGVPFPADVAVAISANPSTGLEVGDTFVYTVTGTNNGPGDATGLLFALTLSGKLSFVSSDCGAVLNGNVVNWSVPALANGASTACNVTVAVVLGGDIQSSVTVSTTTVDPNNTNNSASVVVGFAPVAVPTLDRFGLLLAGLLLLGLGLVNVRRF